MRIRPALFLALLAFLGLLALLALPGPDPRVPPAPAGAGPFAWNRDAFWKSLEARFLDARAAGCVETEAAASREVTGLDAAVDRLNGWAAGPGAPVLDSLERRYFELGPSIAACPSLLVEYVRLQSNMREAIKNQSRRWDLSSLRARERLYRSLYGSRAAVEEAMLHHPDRTVALLPGKNEPSATPATLVEGVEIRSGDLLVSRGGYPTSALIARGNDYPGNFSHVALVHVDSASHQASAIEAHIERGVAVSTADEYLRDKKLRVMVMRPRADLPPLLADPMLPHRAASLALERARSGHIPYDFTMDYADASRLFCSEVASSVYRERGIMLWTGLSTISAPGLRRWLASFGVRHFETQEPSDLEYDPQLVVVAEWRDPAALLSDHIDNAVTDAMLEGAEAGDDLFYPWYQLPVARLAKAWSWVLNRVGRTGPIPEGMAARAALRNRAYIARHRRLADEIRERAGAFAKERGYPPPYWVLLELAREVARIEDHAP